MVFNAARSDHRINLEAFVDTDDSGRSYIALKLWFALRKRRYVNDKLSPYGRDLLHAADPATFKVPPMQVQGVTYVPLRFPLEDKWFPAWVKLIRHLRY